MWHQLTGAIEDLVATRGFEGHLLDFYNNVVSDFEGRLNPTRLMAVALKASRQCGSPEDALDFLERVGTKVRENDAYAVKLSEEARLKLAGGDPDSCKALLEEAETIVSGVVGMDSVIHGHFYYVSAEYDNVKGAQSSYYKNMLLYLACTPTETLDEEEQIEIAFNLGRAALLSTTIYNFGELLGHDILSVLDGSDRSWLSAVLRAFNAGDIDAYEAIKAANAASFADLGEEAEPVLAEKIGILALVEMLFSRSSADRIVSFTDIAEVTRVRTSEVEHLVMRALSLKLIKGLIDEVDGTLDVSWVQPRVLDMAQLGKMRGKLAEWNATVDQTLVFMTNETPELFT